MKKTTNWLAAICIATTCAATTVQAAPGTNTPLTDADWQSINAEITLENANAILDEPQGVKLFLHPLSMGLKQGHRTQIELNAPYASTENVGVVVLDEDGEILFHESGKYGELKQIVFDAYYNLDHTYVVRVYTAEKTHESKVQVVYR